MPKTKIVLALSLLILTTLACNALMPTAEPPPTPVVIIESTTSPQISGLPVNEAAVPRVEVEVAKAAFDSGEAIIVDVRSKEAYDLGHVAGAINIPLSEVETNPAGLSLDKNQWIITYCTWQNEHTSARAAFVLLQNGYTKVTPILGGLQAWENAGYAVEP